MKKLFIKVFAMVTVMSIMSACVDLDVENTNNADLARSLSNADEFDGIVNGQFALLFQTDTYFHTHTLSTMGDEMSMSWGNWGCRELSIEPREAIPNDPAWNYAYVIEDPWSSYFSVIGSVNDVLRAYELNPELVTMSGSDDITYQVKAKAKFLQGAAYGAIAKLYDKAKIVDETTDLLAVPSLEYTDYAGLADAAVAMLEDAITLAESGDDFTIGAWNGQSITRDEFVQIIRSWQAKTLLQNARSDAENTANDWAAIASYATDGVDFDLAPIGDGGNNWYDYFIYYGNEEGWSRVDMRIVSMLAPGEPSRFPTDGTTNIGSASFNDARGNTYMTYYDAIPFRAERGYYHYSHYDFSRYDYHYDVSWSGPMPYMTESENNLILAEALIRSGGSKTTAADLINNTRVANGGLAALTGSESNQEMLDALFYERFIEMISTSPGSGFYDRRRLPEDDGSYDPLSGLQPCTPRNFPIPASELQLLSLEVYTFGGC